MAISSLKLYLSIELTQEMRNLARVNTYSLSAKPVPCVCVGRDCLSASLTCFKLTRGLMYNSSARL